MKPAKTDRSKKSGGRDVAIWFSILEYLEANPDKSIFFVTNNTADFGEPGNWPFPLDLDLREKAARVTQLLTLDDVLERFTESAEPPAGIHESLIARLTPSAELKKTSGTKSSTDTSPGDQRRCPPPCIWRWSHISQETLNAEASAPQNGTGPG